MTTCIYLDQESKETLKKIKENEPDFNLSNYVKLCISNYNYKGEDIEKLQKRLLDIKTRRDYLNNEAIFIEDKIKLAIDVKNNNLQSQKELDDYKEYIKIKEDWLLNMTDEQEKEYRKGLKDGLWKSYSQYYDSQYKGKEVNKP